MKNPLLTYYFPTDFLPFDSISPKEELKNILQTGLRENSLDGFTYKICIKKKYIYAHCLHYCCKASLRYKLQDDKTFTLMKVESAHVHNLPKARKHRFKQPGNISIKCLRIPQPQLEANCV